MSEAIDHQREARARTFIFPNRCARRGYQADLPPGPLDAAEAISLPQALGAVPDPRKARGRRHGLHSMLRRAVGAVLTAVDPVTVQRALTGWVMSQPRRSPAAARRRRPAP